MAASVWGPPTSNDQIRTWRGTANGLEGVATMTSDTLLILDEMGQADAREVDDTVYMLANESGKQRAGRTGTARQRYSWRVTFLSTGELTLAQKMNEAGKQAKAGLEVRLVNLPADARAGLGVFQNLHGRQGGAAAFADELRTAALAHHGHAARAFLRQLTQDLADDPTGLRATLNELRSEFMLQHVPAGATGQVRSVAGRFALVAAAGELARDYGILPWAEGEALRAVGRCFDDWLAARGGTGASEEQQAIVRCKASSKLTAPQGLNGWVTARRRTAPRGLSIALDFVAAPPMEYGSITSCPKLGETRCAKARTLVAVAEVLLLPVV